VKPANVLNRLRRILSQRFGRSDDQNVNMTKLVEAYQVFAETDVGKIVLNDLLEFTGIEKDPYCEGDSHGTSRLVGAQRVGRRILTFMGTDLRQYMILEKEMRDEHKEHKKSTREQTAILE